MKILFIHQNFPGQFVHLARALATLGHEVLALTSRLALPKLPGVHCVTYLPRSIRSSIENGNTSRSKNTTRNGGSFAVPCVPNHASPILAMADNFEAKLARADSAAKAMEEMKTGGFVPDLVIGHSGWGEALFVKAVFPGTRLLIYAEYFYRADGGDFGFNPEFSRQSMHFRHKSVVDNLHLMQALVGCDAAVSPTLFQKSQHPPELQRDFRHSLWH